MAKKLNGSYFAPSCFCNTPSHVGACMYNHVKLNTRTWEQWQDSDTGWGLTIDTKSRKGDSRDNSCKGVLLVLERWQMKWLRGKRSKILDMRKGIMKLKENNSCISILVLDKRWRRKLKHKSSKVLERGEIWAVLETRLKPCWNMRIREERKLNYVCNITLCTLSHYNT